jgi:hypothetical protein
MNKALQKEMTIKSIVDDLTPYQDGVFLTLNVLHKDRIKFEEQLNKMFHWLNEYCFGKSYIKNLKRLKIVATTEVGSFNHGLHAHITIMFNHDMVKSIYELKTFIESKWHKLMSIKINSNSNLVNIRLIGNLGSTIEYSLKTFYRNYRELNPLYF